MNENVKTPAAGLYAALAKAQTEMGKAFKYSNNPHFKSKYADLGSVMDACLPALNKNGIAVLQPTHDEDGKMYVKTVLVHGESGEIAECRVPLIVAKNDMQGYGSAVTYARRYGLMSMAGIAPEDDDGNAAAKAAPPAKADARPIYAVLQADMRKHKSADDLLRWWKDPDVMDMKNHLPSDWLKNLKDEFVELGKSLREKDTAPTNEPEFT